MSSLFKKILIQLILLLILVSVVFGLYTWASLNWVYSSGERAGYVQKFSLKGYACKTWEGELILVSMPGTQAEKFDFTVKNEVTAQKINNSLGKRVKSATMNIKASHRPASATLPTLSKIYLSWNKLLRL